MDNIEIKLSKEEYKTFLKFLYFADYCASSGLISDFKNTEAKNKLFDIITKIYKLGDKLNIPKSFSLTSLVSEVRFSEEELLSLKQKVESDLENIAHIILAQKFAKKDLNLPQNDYLFDHEGGWMTKNKLISEHMQKYLKEFKNNGISNLKFKIFYNLPDNEDED
jgi:hypothetical protein